MTVACMPIQFKSPFFNPEDSGVSEGAKALRELAESIFEDCSQSVVISLKEKLHELYNLLIECSHVNWDGYGALPINMDSFSEASRFIQASPTTIPEPEVAVDPDGEISLEWYLEPWWVFSVSIGERNEITYAGLFGPNKIYGREYFGDEIPKTILDNLDRLFSQKK